jgi:hypothetical protein
MKSTDLLAALIGISAMLAASAGTAEHRIFAVAGPNEVVELSDSDLANAVTNTGAASPGGYLQWKPAAIQPPLTWYADYTGSGVRVAVLDGGLPQTRQDRVAREGALAPRSAAPGRAYDHAEGISCTEGTSPGSSLRRPGSPA